MTNANVSLVRIVKDWQGNEEEVTVGDYAVWLEQAERTMFMPKQSGEIVVGRGMVFFFDDILNINECKISYNDEMFDIVSADRYIDDDGSFHHLEVTYR